MRLSDANADLWEGEISDDVADVAAGLRRSAPGVEEMDRRARERGVGRQRRDQNR